MDVSKKIETLEKTIKKTNQSLKKIDTSSMGKFKSIDPINIYSADTIIILGYE